MAAALIAPWAMAPAHADGVGSVTTMTGPGSPLDGMYLTYVGCDTIGGVASAPATRINRGPDAAPLGRRSFGLVPSGAGTGSGPTISFLSLASLGAGVDVRSSNGTTGVSYIWVTSLDAPLGHAWRGRASLAVSPASWQHVDTATLPYEWQLIDLTTGTAIAVESSTPTDFVARHGDGAGYVVTGFGCDGNAFNVDAVTGNGRVWDFEGLSLATSITASAQTVVEGEQVSVAGSVTDGGGRITGDPLVLQSRVPGAVEWTDASPLSYVGPDGFSRATVAVTETQEFRWLRPESEYADAGASEPVLVTATPGQADAPAG
ncbi:hypothetical protein [Nocardioides sp.]|uniref:hypothetical protein n=1 Tax=Nocardioides sp. TaxID=35761 RepID=UPI00286E9135|nr:hypothetical protein [Nocardioides sp.]